MIKIVKRGYDKIFYAKCEKCATEIEYQLNDVKFENSPGYRDEVKTIVCPECGKTVFVSLLTKEESDKRASNNPYVCSLN